ncbi:hypothetical protein F4775DRAFT_196865 [Biscogniauxia sp. FL1348]|nr:hypothetical protein F4775DRAFT_196865 [Biscogniauxia sp. FL1348]
MHAYTKRITRKLPSFLASRFFSFKFFFLSFIIPFPLFSSYLLPLLRLSFLRGERRREERQEAQRERSSGGGDDRRSACIKLVDLHDLSGLIPLPPYNLGGGGRFFSFHRAAKVGTYRTTTIHKTRRYVCVCPEIAPLSHMGRSMVFGSGSRPSWFMI